MNDKQLYEVLFPLLDSLLPAFGIPTFRRGKSFQQPRDTQSNGVTIYFHKIGDRRIGFPHRKNVWDADAGAFIHTEKVLMETTFQADAEGTYNGMTQADILNRVAMVLQSDAALAVLKSNNLGILRITDIRQTFFRDGENRYEPDPSFDFVIGHDHVFVGSSPKIDDYDLQIERI